MKPTKRLFPPIPDKPSQEELDALPEDMRAWVLAHGDEIRADLEETNRMIEEWMAEGSPTPSSPEEALKMMHEYSSARLRVRSTDDSRGRRRAS